MSNDIKICIDFINNNTIQGWFINTPSPEEDQLSLYLEGEYKAITLANIEREDVKEIHGQLRCGFHFDIERFSNFKNLTLKTTKGVVIFTHTNDVKAKDSTLISPYSQNHHRQLQKIKIDLSKPINGGNWYDIEPTGRWAGPELESSLIFPALMAGNYQLALKIDNHFCDLETMVVLFNDEPVNFSNTEFQVPIVLQAKVDVKENLSFWKICFKFSKNFTPDGNMTEQRKLAIFLETVTLSKITLPKLIENMRL